MDAITPLEDRRLSLQSELDAAKTAKERNKLGQFATPTGLASDVLAYARELMPQGAPVRFLDPAIGTGSFYAALLREFDEGRIEAAAGFEIDPHYGKPARKLWHDHPLDMRLGDFTTATPPTEGKGYNLVICNPPYVRHHHMDKEAKSRLLAATAAASGVQMAGLAGLYCYFLGLSHAWMEPNGLAGWLIPSEFMDVNYGVPVKRYLLNQVELVRIHRFDPSELQFGDALVSSAVVWFRKRKAPAGHQVEFSYGGTLAKPKLSRMVPLSALQGAAKWTSLAADGVRAITEGLRLADFFDIKRGLATGDNSFFIMTRDQIAAHGLPMQFFKPICLALGISKPISSRQILTERQSSRGNCSSSIAACRKARLKPAILRFGPISKPEKPLLRKPTCVVAARPGMRKRTGRLHPSSAPTWAATWRSGTSPFASS